MMSKSITLPSLCLTCGYGQTSRSNREFDQHDCDWFKASTNQERIANRLAHHAETKRRLGIKP